MSIHVSILSSSLVPAVERYTRKAGLINGWTVGQVQSAEGFGMAALKFLKIYTRTTSLLVLNV